MDRPTSDRRKPGNRPEPARRAARVLGPVVAAVSALALLVASGAAPAAAAERPIRPGVQMYTAGAQCTANFVFTDRAGRRYVGYAAHCAGLGEATETDGCLAESLPLGTGVVFRRGGSLAGEGEKVGRGRLVYSSWLTMQERGTRNANACAYNDFALVRVSAADRRKVRPTVPHWGGPSGVDTDGLAVGDEVRGYGASSLTGGEGPTSPKTGTVVGDGSATGGWSYTIYTMPPGVPGDSGSGYLDASGKAVGVLSTLGILPEPGSNNITDLARALAFAKRHSGIAGLRLVEGRPAR